MDPQENASGKEQSGGAANDPNSSVQTPEELKAELEKLRKHNAELLSEKKGVTTKLSKLEADQQEREKKLLEEQGKYKELHQLAEKKSLEIGLKLKTRVLDQTIMDAFRKAGCTDEKKLSTLMNFKPVANYGERVKFDEDYQADPQTLEAFISEVKTEFSPFGFFEVKTPNYKDVDPVKVGEKDFASMSAKEQSDVMKKLLQEKK